jgi:iron complex transport system substrate-binding protein
MKDKPQRVVSLVGSYAETWILAGGDLVGVTNDVISERKMDLHDETKIVGTIKDPNLEEIIALSPDFVYFLQILKATWRFQKPLKNPIYLMHFLR